MDFAGKFGGEVDFVVDEIFDVHAGKIGEGEECFGVGFPYVAFVFGNAAGVHLEAEASGHFSL